MRRSILPTCLEMSILYMRPLVPSLYLESTFLWCLTGIGASVCIRSKTIVLQLMK